VSKSTHSLGRRPEFIKGKSAIRSHRQILGKKNVAGLHFWSRGYDEKAIRKYIREKGALEERQGEFEFHHQIKTRNEFSKLAPPFGEPPEATGSAGGVSLL
jgi:hypothetical protein